MKLPRDVSVIADRSFIELDSEISAVILRILKKGWLLVSESSEVNTHAAEVPMTERLRDGMRSALRDDKPFMVVLPGTESRSRPEVALPDGRTDIPILCIEIFLRFGEHDPHAIIECKRIAGSNARLCREYVVNGIDRFRTGKYAGNRSTGFMAGYLIAGDASSAAHGVNRYLNAGHMNREPHHDENLKPSTLVPEPWAWTSCHPREGASEVVLHHAFLPLW